MSRRRLGVVVVFILAAAAYGESVRAVGGEDDGADLSAPAIKAKVEEILSNPPFRSSHTAYRFRYRGELGPLEGEAGPDEPVWLKLLRTLGRGAAVLSELVLWGLALGLLAVLVIYRDRWLRWFSGAARSRQSGQAPGMAVGHDRPPRGLPQDTVAVAWASWQRGERRACLSLLYRGALERFATHRQLEFSSGATEDECLRAVVGCADVEVARYFHTLARTWQAIAYAARAPSSEVVQALCRDWQRHFGSFR